MNHAVLLKNKGSAKKSKAKSLRLFVTARKETKKVYYGAALKPARALGVAWQLHYVGLATPLRGLGNSTTEYNPLDPNKGYTIPN
jgi:hypothetical protein